MSRLSMKEIASELHLSINAVSLALNNRPGVSEETRRAVIEKAKETGYLDKKKQYYETYASNHIGLFVSKGNYQSRFYNRVISGIESASTEANVYPVVRFLEQETEWEEDLKNRIFGGVMVVGVIEEDVLERIASSGVPLVLVDSESYSGQYDSVVTENRLGTVTSVSYLLDRGYRKIGFFGDYHHSHSIRERFWGYLEALSLSLDDVGAAAEMSERYSILGEMDQLIVERNTEAVIGMLREKKGELPETYQCANDEHAAVLSNALKMLGYRIPEDIALVGFDDSDVGTIVLPKLTTLHVQRNRMGKEAFRKLHARMISPQLPVTQTALPVELIVRGSTGEKEIKS